MEMLAQNMKALKITPSKHTLAHNIMYGVFLAYNILRNTATKFKMQSFKKDCWPWKGYPDPDIPVNITVLVFGCRTLYLHCFVLIQVAEPFIFMITKFIFFVPFCFTQSYTILAKCEDLSFISTGNYKKLILSKIKEVFLHVCTVRSSHQIALTTSNKTHLVLDNLEIFWSKLKKQ